MTGVSRLDRIEQEARDHADPLVVCDLGAEGAPCVLCCLNQDAAGAVLALVAVARAAQRAVDADARSAGAWTSTGEQAVRDLASALDDVLAALAALEEQ